ncbi:MAG: thiolase family protein [Armatimonadota bacterium]|nr:thiolase family protein [Armatimonadota bacterium]MDR7469494.1 thiolase family protein [Armatimonadota bacterium]MDR7475445.1 thiolase family protein [Armatimonadota bacterium]
MQEVDAVVTASVDLWDGLTASNVAVTEVVGAVMKPETRVAGDGLLAVCHATMIILSGNYKTVLVVAHGKASMADRWELSKWTFDPIYQQPLDLDDLVAGALQAQTYLGRYQVSPDAPALVAVKNRKEDGLTVDAVLTSPVLAPPIHDLEVPPEADGACALLLGAASSIGVPGRRPARIRGFGYALETHYLGDRDLANPIALREAAIRAYRMAGIGHPRREIQVAHVSELFAHQELLWYEGLDFCDRGQGAHLLIEGVTSPQGTLPVNPRGGVLAGVPPFVAGLDRLVRAVEDVTAGVTTALAHGAWGPGGQGHCVVVVGE